MFKEAFFGIYYSLAANRKLVYFLFIIIALTFFNGYFKISYEGCSIIYICAGIVYSAEMFNTAIEHLCDRITIQKDYDIKLVKDISAGAVLLFCFVSLIVAFNVYYPAIMKLWFGVEVSAS